MEGIPCAPAGKEAIDVAFSYNQNGILEVSAEIVSTGKEAAVTINMMDVQKDERVDVSGWRNAPGAEEYRTIIRRTEKFLKKEAENLQYEEELREVEELLYLLKKAIIDSQFEMADELEEDIDELMEDYRRV